jgi:hypothetical protein
LISTDTTADDDPSSGPIVLDDPAVIKMFKATMIAKVDFASVGALPLQASFSMSSPVGGAPPLLGYLLYI